MRSIKFLAAALISLLFVTGTTTAAYSMFKDTDGIEATYSDSSSQNNSGYKPAVDDIEENWQHADNNRDDDWYTLYFFIQQEAAKCSSLNPQSYTPTTSGDDADKYGFWREPLPADNTEVQQQSKPSEGQHEYGWRSIRVYRSISSEQLQSVGVGETKKANVNQNNSWFYSFSGWTANKCTAASMITEMAGEYNYFSTQMDLKKLDSTADDGSNANDHIIYLFPIYTFGKRSTNIQPTVMIQDKNYDNKDKWCGTYTDGNGQTKLARDNTYLSQSREDNTLYYVNDFTVTDETRENFQFQVSQMNTQSDGSGNTSLIYHSAGGWAWKDTLTGKMFPEAGGMVSYNIYFKLYMDWEPWNNQSSNQGSTGTSNNSNDTGNFTDKYGEECMKQWLKTLDAVPVFTARLTEAAGGKSGNQWKAMVGWLAVCRVFEPRILTAENEDQFEYGPNQPRVFKYDGFFGDTTSYDSMYTQEDELVETYAVNQIPLDNESEITISANGSPFNGDKYKGNVFTLGLGKVNEGDKSFWKSGKFSAMSECELSKLNSTSGSGGGSGGGEGSSGSSSVDEWFNSSHGGSEWQTLAEESGNGDVNTNSANSTILRHATSGSDYTLAEGHSTSRDLLAIDGAGYYDLAVIITYKKTENITEGSDSSTSSNVSSTDTSSEDSSGIDNKDPSSFVTSIKIAARPAKMNTYFIYIYENDKFDYHGTTGNEVYVTWNWINVQSGQTNTYGNKLAYYYEFNALSTDALSFDCKVFTKVESGGTNGLNETDNTKYSINDILNAGNTNGNNQSVFDHVTKRDLRYALKKQLILDRNYILTLSLDSNTTTL